MTGGRFSPPDQFKVKPVAVGMVDLRLLSVSVTCKYEGQQEEGLPPRMNIVQLRLKPLLRSSPGELLIDDADRPWTESPVEFAVEASEVIELMEEKGLLAKLEADGVIK